jgi:hypothetical protein
MSLKKYKLESRLSLYKIANENCATLAKDQAQQGDNVVYIYLQEKGSELPEPIPPSLTAVFRLFCLSVYAERSPTYKIILMANHHKLLTPLSSS